MKIFLSFLQSGRQHGIPAFSFWEYYIKNGIAEAGHEWTETPDVDWALGLVPKSNEEQSKWKQEAWGKTLAWLKKNPADIFLSYLFPQQVDEDAIRQIQKLGIPCVNFFCDHVREFSNVPIQFSAFDLNWVPEYKALPLYQKAGYSYINLPMPIWVEPGLRVPVTEINSRITFIGSKDIQRQFLFEGILSNDPSLPLDIYGKGWGEIEQAEQSFNGGYTTGKKLVYQFHFMRKNGIVPYLRKLKQRNLPGPISISLKSKVQGNISFEQYNQLTARSMVTVGVNRFPSYRFPFNAPGTYSRLRDIEAPMLGACYLTEYTEGLEHLYDIGAEIEVYHNTIDFIEKTGELQKNPDKRKALRIAGQQKALNEHHIPGSINKILQKIRC